MTKRKARASWLGLLGGVLLAGALPAVLAGRAADTAADGDPNAACAGCHRDIYERYRKTPMANASGLAVDGFLPGSYTSAASGVSYRIFERDGRVWLGFERASAGAGPGDGHALKGERELRYFLGSGTRGRTYLFEEESGGQGYWFEIPINWYAKKRVWEMAPNYAHATEMPLTMPVDPGCLRCHASGAQPSLPEARNKYAAAPFLEGGITCVACHDGSGAGIGSGTGAARGAGAAEHIASGGKAAMLRIGALDPVKRDSVCLSCHLEGDQAVVHAGRRLVDFRPGESVFDYASYFVGGAGAGTGRRATSQWEALLRSGCKRGAGDALTCTSCHDPHASTAGMGDAERVEFYRGKCLACHEGSGAGGVSGAGSSGRFGEVHHPEERDCAACHMPRATANDIAHEQVTDHAIPRVPMAAGKAAATASVAGRLVAVGAGFGVAGASSDRDLGRDLGLAYALAASRGDLAAGEMALGLLKKAEGLAGNAGGSDADHELHEQLGFLEQMSGDKAGATREYGLALAADPHDSVAAGNLALLKVGDHQYEAAIGLWERAFGDDPVQLKAGMNLARVECGLGRKEAALGVLDRLLRFSPDDGAARELARGIRAGTHGCGGR